MVPEESQLERDTALFGVTQRSGVGAVGYRHDHVRFGRVFARELFSKGASRPVDADLPEPRVGPSEIHQLEDTGSGLPGRREGGDLFYATVPDLEHLAGRQVPYVLGTHDVEGTGFTRHHVAIVLPTQDERAEAPWVPHCVDRVSHRHHQGERAFQIRQSVIDLGVDGLVPGTRYEVDYHLGVARGLEDRTLLDQPSA